MFYGMAIRCHAVSFLGLYKILRIRAALQAPMQELVSGLPALFRSMQPFIHLLYIALTVNESNAPGQDKEQRCKMGKKAAFMPFPAGPDRYSAAYAAEWGYKPLRPRLPSPENRRKHPAAFGAPGAFADVAITISLPCHYTSCEEYGLPAPPIPPAHPDPALPA